MFLCLLDKIRRLPINEEEFEWALDNESTDNDDNTRDTGANMHHGRFIYTILGFHPFKEIIFLYESEIRVVAYHYSKVKVQDLGTMNFQYCGPEYLFRSFP